MHRRHLLAASAALAVPTLALSTLALPTLAWPAAAQTQAVDLLLVLAMDASGSIDAEEFRLQREGYAEALTAPDVVDAIRSKPHAAIGVAVLEWGSPGGAETVVPWMRVSDAGSASAVGHALLVAERSEQSYNAIGDALDHAMRLLAAAPWPAAERVIDLSGDGTDMRGHRRASEVRDAAVAAGITVNALAVANSYLATPYGEPLAQTYEREVIGGAGAFVVTAESRRDIARALRGKLVREIA